MANRVCFFVRFFFNARLTNPHTTTRNAPPMFDATRLHHTHTQSSFLENDASLWPASEMLYAGDGVKRQQSTKWLWNSPLETKRNAAVRNQGKCGSCMVHATLTQLEIWCGICRQCRRPTFPDAVWWILQDECVASCEEPRRPIVDARLWQRHGLFVGDLSRVRWKSRRPRHELDADVAGLVAPRRKGERHAQRRNDARDNVADRV